MGTDLWDNAESLLVLMEGGFGCILFSCWLRRVQCLCLVFTAVYSIITIGRLSVFDYGSWRPPALVGIPLKTHNCD